MIASVLVASLISTTPAPPPTSSTTAPAPTAPPTSIAPGPLAQTAGPLVVEDAWVRLPPPGATMCAGYLRLKNPGDVALQVVGAQTSMSARAELHTHLKVDGVMKMRPVPFIEVPAHGEVTLAPGGLHLMLMEPKRTPTEGELVDVVFSLKDGRAVSFRAVVRREAPPPSSSAPPSSPSATPHHHH
jgi:copper(I)-binding protein